MPRWFITNMGNLENQREGGNTLTNTALLKETIARSGYKVRFVAAQIGITPQALYARLARGADFTASEIVTLSKLFRLTAAEQRAIFFCPDSSQTVY